MEIGWSAGAHLAPTLFPSPGNSQSFLYDIVWRLGGSLHWLQIFHPGPSGLIHTLPSLFPFVVWCWGQGRERWLSLTQSVQKSVTGALTLLPFLLRPHISNLKNKTTIVSIFSWVNYVECLADWMVELSMRKKHIQNNTSESLYQDYFVIEEGPKLWGVLYL